MAECGNGNKQVTDMTTSSDPALAGRRILLVGGGSGIGLATARLAAAADARLAVSVLDDAEAAMLAAELPEVPTAVLDVKRRDTVKPTLEKLIAELGGAIDTLIYCAGIILRGPAESVSDDDWDQLIEINLTGCFRVARTAIPALRVSGQEPSIVVISSQLGIVGYRNGAPYAASKSGLNGLVRSLALEHAAEGLRVNAVGPGPTTTPLTAATRADPAMRAEVIGNIPMERYGEPSEIAEVILFLASARASFVTGQLWCVDGGYVAR